MRQYANTLRLCNEPGGISAFYCVAETAAEVTPRVFSTSVSSRYTTGAGGSMVTGTTTRWSHSTWMLGSSSHYGNVRVVALGRHTFAV